ncbi:hypothetical protein DJ564_20820 [Pseudomonas sp. 31-12]|uniref:hypothetical protein n=1 Tax=Pseudomonas sp. 31-12 TaxID=2201356 RepID=UPI000D6CB198|nr:hypothetical protein [Pseudomonas sp. 31-12]AWM93055.1 hypothetical protein DJ564_20820 [Pseudomonas sp. 31-12]
MSLESLERSLYENSPSDALRREFRSLNRHLGEHVKPGQIVIFSDSRHYMCRREEAQMMIAAQKVNDALKDLSDEEASFLVEHHEVIEPFLGITSGGLGVASFMISRHLEDLGDTLKELERLHQEQYQQHRHLHSPEFFARRKRLMAKLDAGFGPLVRGTRTRRSSQAQKKRWGFRLVKLFIIGTKQVLQLSYRDTQRTSQQFLKPLNIRKTGGYVAIALGAGSAAMKISEACRSGREEECRQVKFVEGLEIVWQCFGRHSGWPTDPSGCPCNLCCDRRWNGGLGGLVCMLMVSGAVIAGTADGGCSR